MSRAGGIWIVREGHAIVGVWTVKREMVHYLNDRHSTDGLRITRFQDNNPRFLSREYTIEEGLHG